MLRETISTNGEVRVRDNGRAQLETQPDVLRRHRDEIAMKLVQVWESVLGRQTVGLTDDFFQLGGTSLQAGRLFAYIEDMFGIRLSFSVLLQSANIRDLSEVISNGGASNQCSSLVEIQSGCGGRPPLFCIHGQSGNLLMYRNLAKHLGPDQPVYGLQPAELNSDLHPLGSIEEMAAAYVIEIQTVQPHGPYFLAGFCMGGTIALEIAQQLRKQGETIDLLALLETYNWRQVRTTSFLHNLYYDLHRWWIAWRHFLQMPSGTKLKALQNRSAEMCSKSELSERNMRLALSYVPRMYPGKIFHVCPKKQYAGYNRPEVNWDKLAVDGAEKFYLSNFPEQMLEEPFIRTLAAKLRSLTKR